MIARNLGGTPGAAYFLEAALATSEFQMYAQAGSSYCNWVHFKDLAWLQSGTARATGLFDRPVNISTDVAAALDLDAFERTAREAAQQSITLLINANKQATQFRRQARS